MEETFVLHLQRRVIPPMRMAMHDDCRWDEEAMSLLERWTSIGGGSDDGCWSSWYCWCSLYCDVWRTDLVDALDGDTVSVEVGAALGKLIHALDRDTVCVEVGAALGKLVEPS